eukprot:6375404-Prymnesium_polylepis.1
MLAILGLLLERLVVGALGLLLRTSLDRLGVGGVGRDELHGGCVVAHLVRPPGELGASRLHVGHHHLQLLERDRVLDGRAEELVCLAIHCLNLALQQVEEAQPDAEQ